MELAHKESLEEEGTHATDEARMILPGVQAILGFQLIAVFNQRFQELTEGRQFLHPAAGSRCADRSKTLLPSGLAEERCEKARKLSTVTGTWHAPS